MTTMALIPGMRDLLDMLLAGFAASRPEPSKGLIMPETREERHEMIDEILLTNPACCASEFGVQWMYTKYGRE